MSPKPSKDSGGGEQLDARIDDLEQRVTVLEQSDDADGTDLPRNRVWDTSGRPHGEFTGENDASVIVDAIADRTSEASIVIPDPGFVLDWDQQVDLPHESTFALETVGVPQVTPPADFTDEYAIYKASERTRYQYLGPLYISDSHGVLTEAIHLEDVRGATLDRIKVYNAPGIRIVSEDIYSNQNVINHCEVRLPGSWADARNPGPGIVLDTGSQGNTTDQNWIFAPHYNATRDHTGEVGYIDRGKINNWMHTRFEFGHTVHLMEGGSNYYISEGGWDRPSEYTVRERGGTSGNPPSGFIENVYGNNFELLRILSPNTKVGSSGAVDSGARPRLPAVDILEDAKKLTSARSLESCGLQDDSSGGSVSVGPSWYYKPFLSWSTGSSSGNTAELSTGTFSMTPSAMPKAAYSWAPRGSSDDGDVIARTGLYGDSGNYYELIYDPNDALGGHPTGNWYLEVAQDGELLGCIDTGVAPHKANDLAFNVVHADSATRFCGSVDCNDFEIEGGLREFSAQMKWRWELETLADDGKQWLLRDDRGMRFYKY